MPDVAAVVHSFKGDLGHGLIGASESLIERVCGGGDAENAPAGCDDVPADLRCPRMKNLNARYLGCRREPRDGETVFVAAGIAAGTGDDAGRSAGSPAQRRVGEVAVDAGLDRVDQIAFETDKDGLGFRIAEAGVEFEHLRSARGHHEAAIEDSGEGSVLRGHAFDRGDGDVLQNPLGHGGIEKRIGGVDAHTAGVGAGVAFADALVILRGNERRHVLAVAEAEKADLVALDEFLNDDLLFGRTEKRAGEETLRRFNRRGARIADDDALACGEAVGFDHDGRMKDFDRLFDFGPAAFGVVLRAHNHVHAAAEHHIDLFANNEALDGGVACNWYQ